MCCCCEKKTGHLVVVWFMLLNYVASVIAIIAELSKPNNYPGVQIAALVYCVIMLALCALDIYAIHNNKTSLMIPLFIGMVISVIIAGVGVGICLYSVIMMPPAANFAFTESQAAAYEAARVWLVVGVILSLVALGLFIYFCYVVWTHREEVLAQEVRALQPVAERKKPRRESWTTY